MPFRVQLFLLASLVLAACNCGQPATQKAVSELVASPGELDFGRVATGSVVSRTLTLSNHGRATLTVSELSLAGLAPQQFSVKPPDTLQLLSGASIAVNIVYAPDAPGDQSSRLLVRSDADNAPELTIPLVATALSARPCASAADEGQPCNDGDPCTEDDTCEGGKCGGEPKACVTPPAGLCTSASSYLSYASPGVCSAGLCQYTSTTQSCSGGCSDNVCSPDPCGPVTCNAPPQCFKGGACVGGSCQYPVDPGAACDDRSACTVNDTCGASGQCAGTPKTCASPPAPTCSNPQTKRTYDPIGACATGVCSYASHDVACPAGSTCAAGQCACVPATCAGLGKNCGSMPDGCGGTLSCGTCGAFDTCGGGSVANVCGSSCPPPKKSVGGACIACDVIVPTQQATIALAIAAAPSPGNVCVMAGTYTEELTLRPHVSIYGVGPTAVLEGHLSIASLSDANPVPTVLSNFKVQTGYLAAISSCPVTLPGCSSSVVNVGRAIALHVDHVIFDLDPNAGTVYCADFEPFSGSVDIAVADSLCRSDRGFRLNYNYLTTQAETVSVRYVFERNRFEKLAGFTGINWAIELGVHIDGNGGSFLPLAGSKVTGLVRNNEFFQDDYVAVQAGSSLHLQPGDVAASHISIANNTFVTVAQKQSVWIPPGSNGTQVEIANNLFWNSPTPIYGMTPTVNASNQIAPVDPFTALASGDLRLKPGSGPIDAAAPTWAPGDDKDGLSRPVDGDGNGSSLPDVGAHEYR